MGALLRLIGMIVALLVRSFAAVLKILVALAAQGESAASAHMRANDLARPDRPLYKKKRLILPVAGLALFGVAVACSPPPKPTTDTPAVAEAPSVTPTSAEALPPTLSPTPPPPVVVKPTPVAKPTPRPIPRVTKAPAPPAPVLPVVPVARSFRNCDDMHTVYPHGVGQSGAADQVRGNTSPVTDFFRSNSIYAANSGSDRDHDGIACEAQ